MKQFIFLFLSMVSATVFCQQQKASVYFDYNTAVINAAAAKTLDSMVLMGKALHEVMLSGYCD